MNEMVDKITNLRVIESHTQVSQAQNLQHDFVFSIQESQLYVFFHFFVCFHIKVSIFIQLSVVFFFLASHIHVFF